MVTQAAIIGTNCIQFLAEVNGSYCTLKWSGGADKNGLLCFEESEQCSSVTAGYSVTATIYPQGLSDTVTRQDATDPPPAVTLSGPDSPVEGSVYSAGGGYGGPYTYSTTKGSISSSGVLTGITGECGAVTITATDICGNSISRNCKLPNGVWVLVEYYNGNCNTHNCGDARSTQGWSDGVCSGYTNYYRTISVLSYVSGATYYCADIPNNCTAERVLGYDCGAGNERIYYDNRSTYEWWCTSTVKGW